MERTFAVYGEFPEGVGKRVIHRGFETSEIRYTAESFQEALRKAEEDGLEIPLNFTEELNSHWNKDFQKKGPGLIYEVRLLVGCRIR